MSEFLPSIFVGGPMQYALSNTGFDPKLENLLITILDELKKSGFQVFSAHIEENFGQDSDNFCSESITKRDFQWMLECTIFIAVLPLNSKGEIFRSDGTHIELGWAMSMRKPIILITPFQQNQQYSHLVRGMEILTTTEFLSSCALIKSPKILTKIVRKLLNSTNEKMINEKQKHTHIIPIKTQFRNL
jgi:nucleoside 2-deoxyribosyltransferase